MGSSRRSWVAMTWRTLGFISLPAVLLAFLYSRPAHEPPIFDAQVHYDEASWHRVSVDAVINTADEINIPWMLVGSMPNEGTWKLFAKDPTRVLPMFVPHRNREERESWFSDPEVLGYIERELPRRAYRGIGELWLFDGQVDSKNVHRLLELATERNLVLHVRSDRAALNRIFELAPSIRVLWAHAGMFTQPETIASLLARHSNLKVEISHRGDIAPGGVLAAEWRDLILNYPDRFLLGSGTYNDEYWYQFRYMHGAYRNWLKQLPGDVRYLIGFGNGLELFGLDVPRHYWEHVGDRAKSVQ